MSIDADHQGPRPIPTPRFQPRPNKRQASFPDTPEARAHAAEAEEFKKELRALGVDFEQVSPSADTRGHVRLNFDQLAKLLDLIEQPES